MTAIRVVVCDDNPTVRLTLSRGLGARQDIEVVGEAESGGEAIELVKRETPDVLVMDFFMPEMTGVEAARRLRQLGVLVPIVIFSASHAAATDEDDLEPLVSVQKSSIGELVAAIRDLLGTEQ